MKYPHFKAIIVAVIACMTLASCCRSSKSVVEARPDNPLFHLTSDTRWTLVSAVPLRFNSWHTQGIVKIDELFYVSSVDGDARQGHIFKLDGDGQLIADLQLSDGEAYHPGGMDYDGKYLWTAVAEYHPDSRAIIYRIDPETMTAERVFEWGDHIGAIVHDTDDNVLIGVSWDARTFYRWTLDPAGRVDNADVAPEKLAVRRGSFYVNFQDGQYLGDNLMLWSGLETVGNGKEKVQLGGWEIFDTRDLCPVHQFIIRLYTPSGKVMTANPCAVETRDNTVRAYFAPDENGQTTLYVFETQLAISK
ncbi:MAG: DUF6454 family protein [Tannerella sp.]|jgi:hypothetical protein|nr:DUF6454 family protein [Tannerella sp.]